MTAQPDTRLRALSDTMRAFAEATADYDRLLSVITERMAALVVADTCSLYLLSPDGGSLLRAATHFVDGLPILAALRQPPGGHAIPIRESSTTARILRTRKPEIHTVGDPDELAGEISPASLELAIQLGLRTFLALPMESRGEAIGLLSLGRVGREAVPFNEEDQAVARNLAEHAALAISNAQLLQSLRHELAERTRAEAEAQRFFALVQHSAEFIGMAGLDGTILFINNAGRELVGLGPGDEIAGLVLEDFHTADGMKRRAILREHGRWEGPGQLRHAKTGDLIDTQVSSFLVRDARGEPFCFATVQRDMRETHRLETHLRQMQKLDAIGRLSGGIAHDFANLLTVILGVSAYLKSALPGGSPLLDDVEEIRAAGQRAAALTRQLLAFGRQQVLERRAVDLNEVLVGMEKMIRRLVGEHVEVRALPGASLHRIKIDVGQVEQVIMNLVVNARDAMPDGGTVTLTTANVERGRDSFEAHTGVQPGPYVMLTVTDTGAGMDELTRQRIFEPFFTTKAVGKGTGLGLATVYGIVQQSGGHISVRSAPGAGTTFEICLPRCAEERATVPAPIPVASGRGGGEAILLVEDETQVRAIMRASLTRAGFRVTDAAGPEEALEAIERPGAQFDILVTDVVMPKMNGRLLAGLVREKWPTLKVLYVSGYTADTFAQQGLGDVDAPLIQKPITPEALVSKVREVLDSRVFV